MGSLAGTNDRPRHAWTRIWGSAQNDAAHGEPCTMLAGDRAGNIYVAGHTEGGFDGQPLIGAPDVFLSKFTADGVRVWTRILGSVNADGAHAVATDAAGGVYVAGCVGASVDGLAHAGGRSDMCVWKFDSDGTRVWTRSVGSASDESAFAVVTDSAGNVYVSGYGGAGLNGQTHHGLWDLILCKFSADGVLLWTRMWGGSANDRTFGVAVDPSGNIYVPGQTEGSFDGQPALGGQDYFLSKFDPEGNRLWTRVWGTPVLDMIGGISVGADGFVYVTGGTQGAMDGQSNMGGVDISVTKFSPDGTLLRTRMYGSAGSDGYDTTVWDDRGVMYLIGATSGNLGGEPNRGGFDAFVMELAADGAPVWTALWGSPSNETVRGGVFQAPDALYVAGLTRGSFHGEPPVGAADFYLTKWCLPQSLPVAPPAPTEVTASQGPLADRVLVAWRAVASATSYEIWRGTNALTNAAVRVAEGVPGTEYADTSVDAGLTYYYWVRARNAAGVSPFSSPVTGYARSGQPQIEWVRIWGSPQDDLAKGGQSMGIAADAQGNLYVAGCTEGSFDSQPMNGDSDMFLTKYSSDGIRLWSRIWGSVGADLASDLCVVPNGDVYVAASVAGVVDGQTHKGRSDLALSKFTDSGIRLWTRTWGSIDNDYAFGVGADSLGYVYVGGYVSAPVDGQPTIGSYDFCLTKFSPDGTKLWTKTWGSVREDRCFALTIDQNDHLYMAGYTSGSQDGQSPVGGVDLYLAKIDSDGRRLWSRMWGSPADDRTAGACIDVAIGGMDEIYVAGRAGGAIDGQIPTGASDICLTRFSPTGDRVWTRLLGSSADDYAEGVAVDSRGQVLLTGVAIGSIASCSSLGGGDLVLAEFSPAGDRQWVRTWGSPAFDTGFGLCTVGTSLVYVAGGTYGSIGNESGILGGDFCLTKWTRSPYDTEPIQVPVPPTGLMATGESFTVEVHLNWQPVAGAVWYEVWRGTNDMTNAAILIAADVRIAAFDDRSVDTGLVYFYWLRAVNAAGRSGFSQSTSVLVTSSRSAVVWTRIWGSAADDWSQGGQSMGIATDRVGDVYVAGRTEGAFDGQQCLGATDFFVTKYRTDGLKLWSRVWGSAGGDGAADLCVSRAGDLYIVGSAAGSFDGQLAIGAVDFALTKMDALGNRVWTRLWGSSDNDWAFGVVSDASNNVYVAGYAPMSVDEQVCQGGYDFCLTKFSSAGERLWTRMWGSSADDRLFSLAIDGQGHLYAAGYTRGPQDGQPLVGGVDLYLAKFDPRGDRLWHRVWGSPADDRTACAYIDVAVGSRDDVFVAGRTAGPIDGQSPSGASDFCLTRFASDGSRIWTRVWGSSSHDHPEGVAVDRQGGVYVAGTVYGEVAGRHHLGNGDFCVTKFGTEGQQEWLQTWGSAMLDAAFDIVVVGSNVGFVAGAAYGALGDQTCVGPGDFCLMKLAFDPSSQALRPPAPHNLSASDGTWPDRVELTWQVSSAEVTFEVWRGADNATGPRECIAKGLRSPAYDDFSTVSGVIYFYCVRAVNGFGVSAFSESDTGFKASPIVATPVIVPPGGMFTGTTYVAMSCVTPDASIHFTLDGSEPIVTAPVYTQVFLVRDSVEIRARGYRSGMNPSAVSVARLVRVPAISCDVAQLVQTGQEGCDAAEQSFQLWNSGGGVLRYSWYCSAAWVTVSPAAGVSTGELDRIVVQYRTAGLAPGSHQAVLTATAPDAAGSPLVVPVFLTVESRPAVLACLPERLAFRVAEGVVTNILRQVEIWNSSASQGLMIYSLTDNVDWLTVYPTLGAGFAEHGLHNVVLTNTAALTPGTYTGSVGIASDQAANSPQAIPVFLEITPPPTAVALSTGRLFQSVLQGENGTNQALSIWNAGTARPMAYRIEATVPWLAAQPSAGTSSGERDDLAVVFRAAGLRPGVYDGALVVTGPFITNAPAYVFVRLEVRPRPGLIAARPERLSLVAWAGGPAVTQTVTVANAGTGTMAYAISPAASWLSVAPTGGVCAVGGACGHAVAFDVASLPEGVHTGRLVIASADAGNSPQSVAVECTVLPRLECDPAFLAIRAVRGQNASGVVFEVWNSGSTNSIAYSIAADREWIRTDPLDGASAGDRDVVSVLAVSSNLAVGAHQAVVTVTPAGAPRAARRVLVQLAVEDASGRFEERIVYSARTNSHRQIWAVSPDGTNRACLVDGPGDRDQPHLSPDGMRLAYRLELDGRMALVVRDLRTGLETGLRPFEDGGFDEEFEWMADSRSLVVAGSADGRIVRVGLDGAVSPVVTEVGVVRIRGVSWPDGRLFYAHHGGWPFNSETRWVDLSSGASGVVQPADGHAETQGNCSHDGRVLAYAKTAPDGPGRVFLLDVDGPGDRPFSGAAHESAPDFSPDGRRLTWLSGTNAALCVGAAVGPGTNVAVVVEAASRPRAPNWGVMFVPTIRPQIACQPQALTNSAERGSNPAAVCFRVWNSGNGRLAYVVSADVAWLLPNPASGVSTGEQDAVCVDFITAGLPEGTYTGRITVAAAGGADLMAAALPVVLHVMPMPAVLRCDPLWLMHSVTEGADAARRNVEVWNEGGGFMFYTLASLADWIVLPITNGVSVGEHDRLSLTFQTSVLSPGAHTGEVVVAAAGARQSPQSVIVVQEVIPLPPANPPLLAVRPVALTNAVVEGRHAQRQHLAIWNAGGGQLEYRLRCDRPWVQLSDTNGASLGERDIVFLDYLATNLAAGVYDATVEIATAATVTNVPVRLQVLDRPLYSVVTAVVPEAAGAVTATPVAGGDARYPEGTRVRLRAESSEGYRFRCWQGDAAGVDPVVDIVLDTNKAVTAVFSLDTSFGGRVTNSVTGEPVPGALVRFGAHGVETGPDGRYRFAEVECGEATLAVVQTGYVAYDERYLPACRTAAWKDIGLAPDFVRNLRAQTRAGTRLVDVTFDLVLPPLAAVAVEFAVSADGGASWAVPNASARGDLGADVAAGPSRRILWDAGADWPAALSTTMVVSVKAGGCARRSDPFALNTRDTGAWFVRTWTDRNGNGDFDPGEQLAEVDIYYDGRLETNRVARSDRYGLARIPFPARGDAILFGRKPIHAEPAVKAGHDRVHGAMYRLWLDSDLGGPEDSDWDGVWRSRALSRDDVVRVELGGEVRLELGHAVFEWDLVVAAQMDDPDALSSLRACLDEASTCLYDLTDGQMKLGSVAVRAGVQPGSETWDSADVVVRAVDDDALRSDLDGIRNPEPTHISIGRPPADATGRRRYARAMARGVCQYALGLGREDVDGDGKRASWERYRRSNPDKVPSSYGFMDDDEGATELSSCNDYLVAYPPEVTAGAVTQQIWNRKLAGGGRVFSCWQWIEHRFERAFSTSGIPVRIVAPRYGYYLGDDRSTSGDRPGPEFIPAPYAPCGFSVEPPGSAIGSRSAPRVAAAAPCAVAAADAGGPRLVASAVLLPATNRMCRIRIQAGEPLNGAPTVFFRAAAAPGRPVPMVEAGANVYTGEVALGTMEDGLLDIAAQDREGRTASGTDTIGVQALRRGPRTAIQSSDGTVEAAFPPDAVAAAVQSAIHQSSLRVPAPVGGASSNQVGRAFTLSLDRLPWPTNAVINVRYTDREVAGLDESGLSLWRWTEEGGVWREVPSVLASERNALSAALTGPGTFALFAPPARDAQPPSAITDLVALPGPEDGTVRLVWTAAGDDGGSGRAARCAVRFATNRIADATWDQASLAWVGVPGAPGTPEERLLRMASYRQLYFFAVQTIDEAGNRSPLSNVAATQPRLLDRDGDGLPDQWESSVGMPTNRVDDAGADNDGDGLSALREAILNTNPNAWDTDGDGMGDKWEADRGFDPRSSGDALGDADGDGIANRDEYRNGTDPRGRDTDDDGLSDDWEIEKGLNPISASGRHGGQADPDNDGFSNLEEFAADTDPSDPRSHLRVRGLSRAAGVRHIEFPSSRRRRYDVEFKLDLGDPQWQCLTSSVPGNASSLFVPDTDADSDHRFYRVKARGGP